MGEKHPQLQKSKGKNDKKEATEGTNSQCLGLILPWLTNNDLMNQ
jgi:hypothetical protein